MPDFDFCVETAEQEPFAVAPLLNFKLSIQQRAVAPLAIRSIALRCQIRIEPNRRRYRAEEQEKLQDLFSTTNRWGQTLHPMLWTHASVNVPPFTEQIVVNLPVPCSYDFNVATTKYFDALEEGEIPLLLLFSGTVFHQAQSGSLQVAQIPWEKETTFRLPVRVWKDMMELYYPNCAWLCLRKDAFNQLHHYKSSHGLPTWEQTLEDLLSKAENPVAT
jgi:hypothetical protein